MLQPGGVPWALGQSGFIQSQDLTDISTLAVSAGTTLAISIEGTLYSWLGIGNSPSTPLGTASVISADPGVNHNLAVESDGTVWAWGTCIGTGFLDTR
jgi:alpha-tubulin suppressor-like RCC1 family protein